MIYQKSNPNIIANKFNTYFTEIGPKLANTIVPPIHKTFSQYLINQVNTEFQFKSVDEDYVKKLIDNLKSKSSSGIDRLSNKLVKLIKDDISESLTLIINQIGIFPQK